MPSFQSKEYW